MNEIHVTPREMFQTSLVSLLSGLQPSEVFGVQHDPNGFCWCQPVVEDVPPEGRIYIHRRTLDGPHTETVA